jgi:diacylglycerol kinase family enzyme
MAKELNLPHTIEEALDVIVNGEVQKIDCIRINDELCLHLSDIGLNAMLVKYFENSGGRGMWGYGKAIFRVLWEKQKMKVTLETDEGIIKRGAYMVAIANARKYGTGANINPDGHLADGLFEVVIVRKLNVMEIMKAIFTEKSFHPDKIEILSTKNLKMMVHRKAYFQIDGEFKGKVSQVNASIQPGIICIVLPAVAEPKVA